MLSQKTGMTLLRSEGTLELSGIIVTGAPTNPFAEENWNAAFNKFHSNISSYFEENFPQYEDRLDNNGRMTFGDFNAVFNKYLHPWPNAQHKRFADAGGPNPVAHIDYVCDTNDSDEESMNPNLDILCWFPEQNNEMATPHKHGLRQWHRPIRLFITWRIAICRTRFWTR